MNAVCYCFHGMKPETLVPTRKCTLGCPIMDRSLGGGIPCNSITEVVSESGCGKTQLCLQLLLAAQLPISLGGLAASSLYIHSEFPFPFRRLHQLSLSSHPRRHLPPSHHHHDPLDRIFVHPVHSAHQLLDVLSNLPSFLSIPPTPQFPVKLIVIDSIATLFRSEFENNARDLKRRSSLFFKISSILKGLAKRFELAVVITNQVVDVMESSEGCSNLNELKIGNLGCLYSSGRRVCPALGLSWANCVNSRLFLSRSEEIIAQESALLADDSGDGSGAATLCSSRTRRHLHVLFAPHLPGSSCEFVILREGVFGVES